MNPVEKVHSGYVQGRRVQRLCELLSRYLPAHATVLDVGAGGGWLGHLLGQKRPDVKIQGLDVLAREVTYMPVALFDGKTLPAPDNAYDVVLFVDVLHHTDDPLALLREARRVMRSAIVIKDHLAEGFLARPTLSFMDRVGNRRYGVSLPHNYWSEEQWSGAFQALGLAVAEQEDRLGLYPWPASLVFDRQLHFVARVERRKNSAK